MKPIAAPIVGGMITSTIHVLILVPVFFVVVLRLFKVKRVGEKDQAAPHGVAPAEGAAE